MCAGMVQWDMKSLKKTTKKVNERGKHKTKGVQNMERIFVKKNTEQTTRGDLKITSKIIF